MIYFFDDDTVLDSFYIEKMNHAFSRMPECIAGMGDISNLPPIKYKYHYFRTFFMLPRQRAHGNFTRSGLPTHPYGTHKMRYVEV